MKMYMIMDDIPRVLAPNMTEYGPYRKTDLVTEGAIHPDILKVLKHHGLVKEYEIPGVERQKEKPKGVVKKEKPKKKARDVSLDVYLGLYSALKKSRW